MKDNNKDDELLSMLDDVKEQCKSNNNTEIFTETESDKPLDSVNDISFTDEVEKLENNDTTQDDIDDSNIESLPPITSSDFIPPQDFTKPKKEFNVDLDSQIEDIPDYDVYETKKSKKGSIIFKILMGLIVVCISVGLALGILYAAQDIYGISDDTALKAVMIPQNVGVQQIAEILQENKIIKSSLIFRGYIKLLKVPGNFQYGTFSLSANMSYSMIIEELQKYASKETIDVSFPEGFTVLKIAKRLEANKICKAKEFIEALNTVDFGFEFEKDFTKNPMRFNKYEGYLFPDTYNLIVNDNPTNVAMMMLDNFDKKVTVDMRAKMKDLGLSLEQAITVASIVQKEAGKTEQMRKVSSVYHNRLNNKGVFPNLQACPTRDYANEIKTQMDVINQKMIDAYNTYEGEGLPPGAICNPGIDAIKATLDPETTDYYFFCTNLKSGEFFYAKTLKEHERNIVKAGLR